MKCKIYKEENKLISCAGSYPKGKLSRFCRKCFSFNRKLVEGEKDD